MTGDTGKLVFIVGITLIILGLIFIFVSRLHRISTLKNIGKLPGDICIEKGNFTFYFPFASYILMGIILSIVLWYIGRR